MFGWWKWFFGLFVPVALIVIESDGTYQRAQVLVNGAFVHCTAWLIGDAATCAAVWCKHNGYRWEVLNGG